VIRALVVVGVEVGDVILHYSPLTRQEVALSINQSNCVSTLSALVLPRFAYEVVHGGEAISRVIPYEDLLVPAQV